MCMWNEHDGRAAARNGCGCRRGVPSELVLPRLRLGPAVPCPPKIMRIHN